MNRPLQVQQDVTYMPILDLQRVTAKRALRRIAITTREDRERICGFARCIGYTGKDRKDLAIYRLKVKFEAQGNATTLQNLFVVDEGVFVDYEQWKQAQQKTLS